MRNVTEIKHRIKSVSDTRQITSAMETISVAKMRKSMQRFESNKEYFETIRHTISDIVLHTNSFINKYLEKTSGNRTVYIVIASDKGLAGSFNHNVLNAAWKEIKECDAPSVFTIGQVAREFFSKKGIEPDIEFTAASYEPSMRDAAEIAASITKLFDQNMMDKVVVIYTKMFANHTMLPDIIHLLPLEKEDILFKENLSAEQEYFLHEIEYEPSPDEVLAQLIPQYLSGIIYGALVQSAASEHSTRRAAMSNATNNASEILDELKIEYNRARQESVTSELSEIITSAMGVRQ